MTRWRSGSRSRGVSPRQPSAAGKRPTIDRPTADRTGTADHAQPAEQATTASRRVPARAARVLVYSGAFLLLCAVVWVVGWVAMRLAMLTVSLLVACLLAALCTPLVRLLSRHSVPSWLSSLLSLLLVVGLPTAVGFFVWRRVSGQVGELRDAITVGVDDLRTWLTTGPLALDSSQVDQVRDLVVERVNGMVPSAAVGAMTVLQVLAATILVLFVLFFVLKDGEELWSSAMGVVPRRHRERTDAAGRAAWSTLSSYTLGIVVVASLDALGIGAALYVLGVPLVLSLMLLTFVSAFVPIIGATVSGVVAVLVTLVTNGATDALIMAGVVLLVQQLEGNVLSPLIVGRAVRLHPLPVIIAVTAGTLLVGVVGALVAVPITAVAWAVARSLWDTADRGSEADPAGQNSRSDGSSMPRSAS